MTLSMSKFILRYKFLGTHKLVNIDIEPTLIKEREKITGKPSLPLSKFEKAQGISLCFKYLFFDLELAKCLHKIFRFSTEEGEGTGKRNVILNNIKKSHKCSCLKPLLKGCLKVELTLCEMIWLTNIFSTFREWKLSVDLGVFNSFSSPDCSTLLWSNFVWSKK